MLIGARSIYHTDQLGSFVYAAMISFLSHTTVSISSVSLRAGTLVEIFVNWCDNLGLSLIYDFARCNKITQLIIKTFITCLWT